MNNLVMQVFQTTTGPLRFVCSKCGRPVCEGDFMLIVHNRRSFVGLVGEKAGSCPHCSDLQKHPLLFKERAATSAKMNELKSVEDGLILSPGPRFRQMLADAGTNLDDFKIDVMRRMVVEES